LKKLNPEITWFAILAIILSFLYLTSPLGIVVAKSEAETHKLQAISDPDLFCKNISDGHENISDCLAQIQNNRFELGALDVCTNLNSSGLWKLTCINLIANRSFSNEEIQKCKSHEAYQDKISCFRPQKKRQYVKEFLDYFFKPAPTTDATQGANDSRISNTQQKSVPDDNIHSSSQPSPGRQIKAPQSQRTQ